MTRWTPVAADIAARMRRMRADGASFSEIARLTGESKERVRGILEAGYRGRKAAEARRRRGHKEGAPVARAVPTSASLRPAPANPGDALAASILDMHARGFRSMGIAASLKAPHRVVYETLVRAGLIATFPATPEEGLPR